MRVSATASFLSATRRSAAWRLVAWALLLSFTLQSYITQTHIHLAAYSAGSTSTEKVVKHEPAQAPIDREPATCPFCQAIASSGIFFTPTAPVMLLPTDWAEVAAPAAIDRFFARDLPRGWYSRAPPQH